MPFKSRFCAAALLATAPLALPLPCRADVSPETSTAQAYPEEAHLEPLHFYRYKPFYFLMGSPYTKIEFSFKAAAVRDVPFYLGYTHLIVWDLGVSPPFFYDINYNPDIFYRVTIHEHRWIDLGVYEHESNGRGGLNERSWDRVYLRYHTQSRLGERPRLDWDLKAWIPIQTNPQNADIAQYRGLWELNLSLSDFLGFFFESGDLTFRLYPGGESQLNPLRGGQELTLRVKTPPHALIPLFVAQVFHGYGEYLIDYNVDHWGIRAGIGF